MKFIDYVPECIEKEGLKIKGSLKLRLPMNSERLRYIGECGFKVEKEGGIGVNHEMLGPMSRMIELSEKHYEEIKLEKEDGTLISTFEDMQYEPECSSILGEVAGKLMGGFTPSKN